MSPSSPAVSVVVPTRDRPGLLRWCLRSIAAQSMPDFEVIVCDNAQTSPADDVVKEIDDERVRYVRPDRELAMCDNWELAVSHAKGEYVAVLTDKMALFPTALEALVAAAADAPDVVTWWNTGYRPERDSPEPGAGYFVPTVEDTGPAEYSLRSELERRLSFAVRRDRTGTAYFRGKICFGAFRRDFVDRIRERTGRVFFPITPDYTSMAAASVVGDRGIDLGRPGVISFETVVSNGKLYASDVRHARRFFDESDPSGTILDQLPIPGVFASHHNLVAYDLVSGATRAGGADVVAAALDRSQLGARVAEDLEQTAGRGDGRAMRDEQHALLEQWAVANGISERAARGPFAARARAVLRRTLGTSPTIERLAFRLAGRAPKRYDDVLQAAAANDKAAVGSSQ